MIEIRENISLRPFNTFGIDVGVRRMVQTGTRDEDLAEVSRLTETGKSMVLGEGSNVVFLSDYEGTIVRMESGDVERRDGTEVVVHAGMILDDFIQKMLDEGLYGLENLSAVPGTVGAAVVQNVGAYGVEVKDRLEWVEVYDVRERRRLRLRAEECEFAYRSSFFKRQAMGRYLILRVAFRLSESFVPKLEYSALRSLAAEDAKGLREAIVKLRWEKLPRPEEFGSAGSFFKNPVVDDECYARIFAENPDMPCLPGNKLSAAWMIDRCGWKGRKRGMAGVWSKQALVLYNAGGCTGREVKELAEAIMDDVQKRFGVGLEPEAIMI